MCIYDIEQKFSNRQRILIIYSQKGEMNAMLIPHFLPQRTNCPSPSDKDPRRGVISIPLGERGSNLPSKLDEKTVSMGKSFSDTPPPP